MPWPAPYLRQDSRRGRNASSCCVLLTSETPPALDGSADPTGAAAVATAQVYRALSLSTPDAVILLHPSRTGVGTAQLDGATCWDSPLGTVHAAADICAALAGVVRAGEPEAELPMRHAPFLWFLAAQYDCERREDLVTWIVTLENDRNNC